MGGGAEHRNLVRGKIWRWSASRATGMVETERGDYVWFGLNVLGGRDINEIAIGDTVEVQFEPANQDSHKLRATRLIWT